MGVPVIMIEDNIVVGFNQAKIDEALLAVRRVSSANCLSREGAVYDLTIVGGGPAGLAAAVYAARKLLDTLLVTPDIGGHELDLGYGELSWIPAYRGSRTHFQIPATGREVPYRPENRCDVSSVGEDDIRLGGYTEGGERFQAGR